MDADSELEPAPAPGGSPSVPRLPPPSRCERLAEIVARVGGTLKMREPGASAALGAARLDYALPTHASPEVLDYLRPLATVAREPEFIARLPAGRVFGSGIVLSAEGDAIARDVSSDLGKPFARHWLMEFGKLRAPEPLEGATAVVAVNLGAGYCHWLLEELPRLLALRPGEADNVITHAASPFAREALARRGGRERIVEARRSAHFACAPLLVPSLAGGPGAPTPEALARIDEFAGAGARLGRGVSPLGEYIYVARDRARRRRVTNEAELATALAARGFATVRLEELDWAEQIAAFRGARAVVAPHGAGLANLAFCASGTRVVELVGRAYFNPVFWRLAVLRGLDYRPVLARAGSEAEAVEPIREDRSENKRDLTADVGAVLAALAD